MHCSAGKRLKCSDPIPAEMRSTLLDSERKSQRTRSGVAFEDSARSQEPLHGFRSSRAKSGLLTLDVKMRSGKGRDLSARRDHTPNETRSDRDPCRDRSWLMHATDSDCTHIPFPTSLRKAAAQGEERYWAVQPTAAGGTTSWTHRARAPRSGAQDPRCSALHARLGSSLGITGPGPGETDSDVSLRQNPVTCWTRMEDPHVKAGEVVSRKTPSHGTIRRGRFIKSRPEQFCCTAQLNLPLLTRDPEIKPQYASGFPCRPCRLHIVSCFSVARGSFRQIFLLLEDRGSFRLLLLLEDLSAEVYPDDSTNLPFPG